MSSTDTLFEGTISRQKVAEVCVDSLSNRDYFNTIAEQKQRVSHYPEQFGVYNIHSNNCEMFAWYVMMGKRYSSQTQEQPLTEIGAKIIQIFQPVLTVRSMDTYKLEQAIADKLNQDLAAARKAKLEADQAKRDEFWRQRDAGLI
ncbi:hypothetical protein PCC8801_3926 [Rippkaea orientalis PCC 8801]|uniref:NC domain protein n=1 Tax=Rippkaea orientalis (strain PCC 8801 / RF-1) TaxID=41431 RepID=B7K544_RIPO1|nr:hypothetical protein PCC8801_3926 [Rippkaea orientalis PCC 8801]